MGEPFDNEDFAIAFGVGAAKSFEKSRDTGNYVGQLVADSQQFLAEVREGRVSERRVMEGLGYMRELLAVFEQQKQTAEAKPAGEKEEAINRRVEELATKMEDHRPGGLPAPSGRWADSMRAIVRDALALGK